MLVGKHGHQLVVRNPESDGHINGTDTLAYCSPQTFGNESLEFDISGLPELEYDTGLAWGIDGVDEEPKVIESSNLVTIICPDGTVVTGTKLTITEIGEIKKWTIE